MPEVWPLIISYLRAEALGANAIIGINISYTTFSDIMGVIANGTAVKIESDNNIIQTAKCIHNKLQS